MKFETEFKQLAQKRKNGIEAIKNNEWYEGLVNLLTELYPDEAHFIYEMLQNAEDAGNRAGITENTVTFDLRQDKLIFTHQGAPFEIKDVESITGIGKTTKIDDMVSIGKFGIGFKSVFAYTDTPIIKDRNVAFKIQDLLLPSALDNEYNENIQGVHFEIPFNHSKQSLNPTIKDAETCYQEIEKFLKGFTGIELLFLRNITCMIVKYGECAVKFTKTYNENTHIATIHKKDIKTGQTEQQQWVAFYQDIPEYKGLYTSFAFAIENEKIKEIDGELFVYFPADNEQQSLQLYKQEFDKLDENNKLYGICLLSMDNVFYSSEKLYLKLLKPLIQSIEDKSLHILHNTYKGKHNKLSLFKIEPDEYEPSYFKNPANENGSSVTHRNHNEISTDYKFLIDIKSIFDTIKNETTENALELSVLLSGQLNKYKKWADASKSYFRPNGSHDINRADSTVKTQLNSQWLFDKDMRLVSPKDIYPENLHPDYTLMGTCNLYDILDFKVRDEELKWQSTDHILQIEPKHSWILTIISR